MMAVQAQGVEYDSATTNSNPLEKPVLPSTTNDCVTNTQTTPNNVPLSNAISFTESISFADESSGLYESPAEVIGDSSLLNKRYELVKKLAKGAFGVVHLVRDTKTGNEYALKMIECTDDIELNRAMQEVLPVKDIKHESLVNYLDVFVHNNTTTKFCILMEYYENGDMLRMLEKRKANEEYYDEQEILLFMKQLTEGVHHLHSKGLIHRDLKSQNIFVTNNSESLVIGDFGLVTKLEKSFLSTVAGTLRYMAPEVLSNKKYEFSADVWSLGCIFYELISLRLDRNMYMDALSLENFEIGLIEEIVDQLGYSKDLAQLMVHMLEKEPKSRITTEHLLETIDKMQRGEYSALPEGALACEGCRGVAHVECIGCESFMCNKCFTDSHKIGAMKKHEKRVLDLPDDFVPEINVPEPEPAPSFEELMSRNTKKSSGHAKGGPMDNSSQHYMETEMAYPMQISSHFMQTEEIQMLERPKQGFFTKIKSLFKKT
jgi:serine/threonine protein kinase